MIPEDDGEWMDEDDFDARSIASMAESFRAERTFPAGAPLANITSAWDRLQPHPATGGMIQFCWENPVAWETLAGDVDRQWFMEQLTVRSVEPQVTV
jgi:hypothetical protein